jgi:hypothetical protein
MITYNQRFDQKGDFQANQTNVDERFIVTGFCTAAPMNDDYVEISVC